jgi:GH35 family endo-1,4-beta-xylanase
MIRSKFLFSSTLLLISTFVASVSQGQIVRNGEFDEGTNWWFGFGGAQIETIADSDLPGSSCLVSQRGDYWHGAAQDLSGQLEVGKDYHVQAWIKLAAGEAGTMRVMLYQTDDRGERALKIGEVFCEADQWTQIQAAFAYDPHGEIQGLALSFDNSDVDRRTFDFQVASVTISENDWQAEADARIEQIRKRDVALSFVRSNGQPAIGLEVSAVQMSQGFPFGSTLNDQVLDDPVYQDFFKDHFDWATLEWFSQWKPVEPSQGAEDFSIADAQIDFCEQNGIQVKGHALFWGQEEFRPEWLDGLDGAGLQQAMDSRLSSAVTRYSSRLFGWDVNNEMLNNDFFSERLGATIRSWMFNRARELDSDAKLFLNEYGVEASEAKAVRYRALYDSLVAEGADIGGIGFQAHYDGMVSPKGIEIAMDRFAGSGLGIWFTEYDSVHPDPIRRAQSLEDFYRYTFSRPESEGIIMWGFWAGTHWQGPDAAIVDIDWTVNAAGQRYISLMDEWTTEVEGSTDNAGQFAWRGFHGGYLVTTTDEGGVVNHHLITLNEGELPAEMVLTTGPFDGALTIYGTAGDDVFEYDMASPGFVSINGANVKIDPNLDLDDVRFEGVAGTDQVLIKTPPDSQSFFANENRLLDRTNRRSVRFYNVANVKVTATLPDSRIFLADSQGDDIFDSFSDSSVLTTSQQQLAISGFNEVVAYSNFGNDLANMNDNPGADLISTNMRLVSIKNDETARVVNGFEEVNVNSSLGLDQLDVRPAEVAKSINASPGTIVLATTSEEVQSTIRFSGISQAAFFIKDGNSETIQITGDDSDETLRIAPNGSVYYGSQFRYVFDKDFRSFQIAEESLGNDRLIFRDTAADENLMVNGDSVTISGGGASHSFNFLNKVVAHSKAGGQDTATVTNPTANVWLVGDWNSE